MRLKVGRGKRGWGKVGRGEGEGRGQERGKETKYIDEESKKTSTWRRWGQEKGGRAEREEEEERNQKGRERSKEREREEESQQKKRRGKEGTRSN